MEPTPPRGTSERKHWDVTNKILHAFYKKVYHSLGYGFLEKVYENAMALELRRMGLKAIQQERIPVYYGRDMVGEYFADLLVQDAVLVEIKAVRGFAPEHEAQLLNYLRATPYEVGLLLNFGPKPEFRRRVMDNSRKPPYTWTPTGENGEG